MAVKRTPPPAGLSLPRPLNLTPAVRPAPHANQVFVEGYRIRLHRARGLKIPMLTAAVSGDQLFDTFLALLRPLGDVVDVVVESSHGEDADRHQDLHRSGIDRPVLASHCCEFEDLIVNDGCTGLAALAPELPAEVQLDEHKLLIVYAKNLKPFRRILHRLGIGRVRSLQTLSDSDHIHLTQPHYEAEFEEFAQRLGATQESGDVDEWETGSVEE
jgi:hypothetical protein